MSTRVLFLAGNLGHGGVQRSLALVLERRVDLDLDPVVAVWSPPLDHLDRLTAAGVPVHLAPTARRGPKLRWLRRLVEATAPDIVHSATHYTNSAAWLVSLGTGSRPVGSVVSDATTARRREGWLGHANAVLPRLRLANSENGRRAGSPLAQLVPTRTLKWETGTDLAQFEPTTPPSASPPRIVGVGRLDPIKRWDRLIDASRILETRGVEHEVVIAGAGPTEAELRRRIGGAGEASAVSLLGHVDDVAPLLASASLVALTSEAEGSANTILEAMAAGRAVVATDVGDNARLVADGLTGWIVRTGDPVDLASTLEVALGDRAELVVRGRAGRHRAEAHFDADRCVGALVDRYRALGALPTPVAA